MGIHLEWKHGSIRGAEGAFKYGDPYAVSCQVYPQQDGETVLVECAGGKMYSAFKREAFNLLREQGYKKVVWTRASGKTVETLL